MKKVCVRCGKIEGIKERFYGVELKELPFFPDSLENLVVPKKYSPFQICPDCFKSFENWFDKYRLNKTIEKCISVIKDNSLKGIAKRLLEKLFRQHIEESK